VAKEVVINFDQYAEMCSLMGYVYPVEGVIFVSRRPVAMHVDDHGRTHCEDGPAVDYGPTMRLWYIHGVAVNEQIILHPEKQMISEIEEEKNEEVKRVRIEQYGVGRFLHEIGAECVDQDAHRWNGVRALLKARNGLTYLNCADPSTGRVYFNEVDPGCLTCEQADAYLASVVGGLESLTGGRKIAQIGRT